MGAMTILGVGLVLVLLLIIGSQPKFQPPVASPLPPRLNQTIAGLNLQEANPNLVLGMDRLVLIELLVLSLIALAYFAAMKLYRMRGDLYAMSRDEFNHSNPRTPNVFSKAHETTSLLSA